MYMEPSSSYKRSRDDDNSEELTVKKAKSGLHILKDDEDRKDNGEVENLNDIRIRKTEEYHFLRLFTYVLNSIAAIKCLNDIFICQSIVSIRESFKFKSGPSSFSAIDFSKWENVCGYIYRYGSHGAGFARFRILNAVRNCKIVEEILKKPDLKIICLGTGPGNDAIGLCSALSEVQNSKSLKLTLVDKFKEWSLCTKLAKVFAEEDDFGKVSELFQKTNLEFLFIQTDLPGKFMSDKKYFDTLAEADVIVMSKLLSTLDKSNDKGSERLIVKSLYEQMKEDAVILLNDSFNKEMWSNFYLVYSWGEEKKDEYTSFALAERRFNHDDAISSKLPINVLVKKEQPGTLSILENLPDDSEFF